MSQSTFLRVLFCVFIVGMCLYGYIVKQNVITKLRLTIPPLEKELKTVEERNVRLEFEIKKFEDPTNLMRLASKPEYRHLKAPSEKDILKVEVEDRCTAE